MNENLSDQANISRAILRGAKIGGYTADGHFVVQSF